MPTFIEWMRKQRSPMVLTLGVIVVDTWEWSWRDGLNRFGTILGMLTIVFIYIVAKFEQPEWISRPVFIVTATSIWWLSGYVSQGFPQNWVGTVIASLPLTAWNTLTKIVRILRTRRGRSWKVV